MPSVLGIVFIAACIAVNKEAVVHNFGSIMETDTQ